MRSGPNPVLLVFTLIGCGAESEPPAPEGAVAEPSTIAAEVGGTKELVPEMRARLPDPGDVRAVQSALPEGLVRPGDAKIGDRTWCLASGEVFTISAESAKAEYEGKIYYFCCPGCDQEFLAKPLALLETPPDLGAAAPDAKSGGGG